VKEVKRWRILVIDDDDQMRAAIKAMMDRKGYLVTGAGTAAEAKTLILASSLRPYDLILLDINLGIKSGLELLAELRASSRLSAPILIISGEFEKYEVKKAAELGVVGFLVKPISPAELKERIAGILGTAA
jgi:DNA-binding response OmpR family regulator